MRVRDRGGGGGGEGFAVSLVRQLIVCLFVTAVHSEQNCSFQAVSETLRCSLESLNAPNVSLASASRAQNVRIQCFGGESEPTSILKTNHFGYLSDLRQLSVESCPVRRVPSLAFSGLSGLTALTLSSQESEWSGTGMQVEEDAFTGLNSLRSLNLSRNNLWVIPPVMFCSLSSLTVLNLSTNFLQDTAHFGFGSSDIHSCKLPLRALDLSHNSFSRLPPRTFGQLRKLESLNLANNNLNVIDDLALAELSSLTRLNLAHNQLVALPPQLFSTCCRFIQELQLQNNSLAGLPHGLFVGMEHLVVLNLSLNDITNEWLTPNTFQSMMRLVALDLSHNRLTKLDQSLLSPLTSLQLLDLSHNQLYAVDGNTFLSQYNLHILRLSHNQLDSLDPKAFAGLSVLSSLSLHHNRIENLQPDLLQNCSGLIDLELSDNGFTQVPTRALSHLAKLKTLDLGENSISVLRNDSLSGLQNIDALRLSGNGIANISDAIFGPVPNIKVLNLAHNEIQELEQGVFNSLKHLRMLRLDNNKLKDINGIMAALGELKWLNMSANRLQWFDYAFIPKNLEWLDIHANQIEDLGNYFELIEGFNLKTLDASSNRIRKLEPLSLPSSIEFAALDHNRIKHVMPGTFQNKSNLRKVDLTSNLIKQFQLPALAINLSTSSESVPRFYLEDNPFLCDCEMEWLQNINDMDHRGQYPEIADLAQIQCRLNNNHPNQSSTSTVHIQQVHPDQFVCQYQAHCFALCLCCDFFACDCRMQCPEGCSCFHDSTWSANIIQCSMRGHKDIPPLIPMDATSIYLDGNNFTGTLESQAFIGRKRVQALYLNHSLIEAINNQTFNGLTELEVLHLEDNLIQTLGGFEFTNLTSLVELHLQDNRLIFIHEATFSALVSLEVLHLHGNLLTTYPVWELQILPSISDISLSQNPWSCECSFVQQFQEFSRSSQLLEDLADVYCQSEDHVVKLSENVTCLDALAVTYQKSGTAHGRAAIPGFIPILSLIIAISVILLCTSLVVFVFRTPLRVWLHSKYGVRVMDPCGKCAQDKLYDAFISYSLKDEDFVQQILLPQLEPTEPGLQSSTQAYCQGKNPAYKLCLQHRDLPNTSSISDTFPGIAQLCAKHVLIVSRAYLESDWRQMRLALQQQPGLMKKLKPVIVILEEPSPLDLASSPEINMLLKTGPIIRWNEAGFWNKLRFYLPDTGKSTTKAYKRNLNVSPAKRITNSNTMALRSSSLKAENGSPVPLGSGHNKYNGEPGGGAGGVGGVGNNTWQHYDGLLHSNNSSHSESTRSTGSPHTLAGGNGSSDSSRASHGNVLANPLASDQFFDHHMYQTIGDVFQPVGQNNMHHPNDQHIYHTLDPDVARSIGNNGTRSPSGGSSATDPFPPQMYDTLGKLDVMLPNGQFVPATLVRSNINGRVVPFVDVNSQTMPPLAQGAGMGSGHHGSPMPSQRDRKNMSPPEANLLENGASKTGRATNHSRRIPRQFV
ncbi:hypothetical protein TCAL_07278 [Tigriopus californicus]|uniref:TIR domain-containing protein n=1 Tax=Tigriopus californicus TaxID=6832 RepID=A0A553NBX0_TIGCA|nr:toll-like receptor Tollo [Tigriopus californicus]TRY62942.1 hypothetical protein TCAL_07278 [Tigriopus californicus]